MSELFECYIFIGITIVLILVAIGIACLYYGAILFVLLSILKYFGIIGLMVGAP